MRLEDKPRASPGHPDEILRTTKRQIGHVRTNPGETQDKPRTEKGLAKGRTDRKDSFTEFSAQINSGHRGFFIHRDPSGSARSDYI